MSSAVTSGCQCGSVRYAINGRLFNAHICNCRMCQKAFGNLFAAPAGVNKADVSWTLGEPAYFRSSSSAASARTAARRSLLPTTTRPT